VAPTGDGQCGPGLGVAEVKKAMSVEAMCEREKREKERAGPGTIPAYVHRADPSANEHKRAGLRDGCGALCSLAPDEHKLCALVFKPMNVI
jgi:hypothetical protein